MSKKTAQLIIDSGNDYVIAVKGNQPNLYKQIQQNINLSRPTSVDTSFEQTRDRLTERRVSAFDNLDHISTDWVGLKRIVQVERLGTHPGKPYEETVYYISSIALEASDFAQGIRGHWGVENRLHWVKDVVFDEDKAQMVDGYDQCKFLHSSQFCN